MPKNKKPIPLNYDELLEGMQIQLVDAMIKSQERGTKLVVVFEGRDAAGKDGAIKLVTEFLSVRKTRIVALPKPTEHETTQWFFQRYIAHLPSAGEWVFFNRSWYNRAGVEVVMGFSSPEQQAHFLTEVDDFERMLVHAGTIFIKFWLDISREEQKKRLKERLGNPLKRMKISPLDQVAQDKWDEYSQARDHMLAKTHHIEAPWTVVMTDDKKNARLQIMRHIIKTIEPEAKCLMDVDDMVLFDASEVLAGRRHLNP
jgi:polyphosphate kinase 2